MVQTATAKKLTAGIITLVALSLSLCITTFALVYSTISLDSNLFTMGTIQLNLNDGVPVIENREIEFEPGMKVSRDFFIVNDSTDSVYYRIYFGHVDGLLADVLEITISNGDQVLYRGTARDLTRRSSIGLDDELSEGARRDLTISFYYPPEKAAYEDEFLEFIMCVDAVQAKNNPNRLFE